MFQRSAMRGLPPSDHASFQAFGSGPTAAVEFDRIHHAFEKQAARLPHAIAVEHLGTSKTYRELDHLAERLPEVLGDRRVRPNGRVGLFPARSIPMGVVL